MSADLFILHHWNLQVRTLITSLDILKKHYDDQAIHDLRVAVKRLRAYLKLVHLYNHDIIYTKLFKGKKDLFKVLGKHRDLELGLGMITRIETEKSVNLSFFTVVLADARERSMKWVQQAIEQYDEKNLVDLGFQLQDRFQQVSGKDLSGRMAGSVQSNYLRITGESHRLADHTHAIRKALKDVFYQAEILTGQSALPAIPLSKVHKILDHLGNWHDDEMLLEKLKHFRKDFMQPHASETELIRNVEKSLTGNKKELIERCRHLFNQL